MSMFDLLDNSIHDLADLEEFAPLPAGTYRAILTWEEKEVNDKPSVILGLKVIEVLELANSTSEPPAPGKEVSVTYTLLKDNGEVNTVGQGLLKKILLALMENFGGDTSKEIIENSSGAEVIATVGVQENKKNVSSGEPPKKYNKVISIRVV